MDSAARVVRWTPGLLALSCAVVFGGYLATGLVLDDAFHVQRAGRPLLQGALEYAIRTREQGIVLWQHPQPVRFEFFRPLVAASMWLDRRIWGPWAPGFHLTNLVLHAAAMVLLAALARAAGLAPWRAVLVAAAWGWSLPAASAGWISGRTDVLAGLCTLVASLSLHRWRRAASARGFALAMLGVAGAALSKESGVAAPALAWFASGAGPPGAPALRPLGIGRVMLLAAPAAAVVLAHFAWLHLPLPAAPYLDVPHGWVDGLWLAAKPLGYLACALLSLPVLRIAPYGLLHELPVLLAVLLAFVLVLLRPIVRAAGTENAGRWLGWFALAIAPVIPIISTSLYLYIPLAGSMLLLGTAAERSGRRVFDGWLLALACCGVVLHAIVLSVVAPWPRAFQRSLPVVEALIQARRPARVLVVDAPAWGYALPAELELRGDRTRRETWFLDFAPTPWPAPGSSVHWVDRRTLVVEAKHGAYLTSPIERFLAFDGAPIAGDDSAPLVVRPSPNPKTPTRLTVRFRDDAAREATLVVQYDGGVVRECAPGPR